MELTVRQQDIINAAISIISRKGFQELTTRHLAEAVGVSEAALYRHFDSKDDIIQSILDYFQDLSQSAIGHIHSDIKDPLQQVKAYVMNRYELFMENPDLANVMFSDEMLQNNRALAEHNLDIMHMHRDQLVSSILAAQHKNEVRRDLEPIQLFRIIIGSMRLLVTQWQLSGNKFKLKHEGEKLWQTIEKLISYNQQNKIMEAKS